LINGKAIRIEGGNIEMTQQHFRCAKDGQEWEVPSEEIASGQTQCCPKCNTPQEAPVAPPWCHGSGRGPGRCRRRGEW
jgi:hypothetical protein